MNNIVNIMKEELKLHRVIKYLLGMVLIALGVVFMLRSNLGNSSWDTLHYSMEHLFKITFGTATVIVATLFMIMVIILNKDFKYLLMWIPVIIVGPLIDLFDLVLLKDFIPTDVSIRIFSYILGLSILPLGGAFLIISTYPAGVFDEFNLAVVRKLKLKSLVPTRVIMELTAVCTAIYLGYLAEFEMEGYRFGKIGIGTIIFALTVGIYLKTYLKIFERIGLYENQQTN